MSGVKVLVDATSVPADRGGVGRYVDGLLSALAHVGDEIDLSVVCQRTDAERYLGLVPEAEVIAAPSAVTHRPARLAWEQTGLPMLAQQLGVEVLHSPFYTCPLRAGCPVTVTVHDATFFTERDHYDKARGTFFRSAIKTSLRRANRVVVPSKATRDELVRLLDVDESHVDVAYHGVDPDAFHIPAPAETARVAARLGLAETPYVAFLGVMEPRKNVPNLVRGWVSAVRRMPAPPALVLAGGSGHDDAIDEAVAEVPVHLKVVRPGYLRFADLPGFLGGALVAAYPSYGEGFGLPILEAMACGAPVLTTPRLSLPEVGGDAVAYTGEEPDEIARDLAKLLGDEQQRSKLSILGVERARDFTWQRSAAAHLATWRKAAGKSVQLPLPSLGILCRMLHSVIPAGGSGTRLWPLSRADNPKFLHPLTGSDLTLLQSTVSRLAPLSDAAHRYVVTGTAHAAAVARQLPELPESNILVEPSPRDSAAAIALAAAVIAEREPSALMGSFAADHLIADAAGFAKTVEAAMEMAAEGLLMTIGITPTGPDTSYGYLRRGKALGAGNLLQEFKEKPDHVAAVEYVSSGDYLWNASMFVWRVDVFLAELNRQRPHLHDTVRELAAAWDGPRREDLFGKLWPQLEKISVDYAVMEGAAAAGKVGVVPGDFGWNDVGDFDTLGAILPSDDDSGNVVISPGADGVDVLTLDARRNVLVPGSGRLVATVGTDDLIIVDTPDALLVCPRDRAQDVKKLVDELKNRGDTRLV